MNTIKYEETLELKNKIYIDVRSPYEYEESTIPEAINIPVLLDEERKEVGYLYTHRKIEESKIFAIQSITKRLTKIVEEILILKRKYENIIVFCSRGGYRSKSISSLVNSIDINIYRLDEGYKSYRNYVLTNMDRLISTIKPIVFYGNTGCGKTQILIKLEELKYPVIDLEGLAKHRGSMLGAVGLEPQPTQKMFESLLFEKLYKYKNSYLFMEGESKRIGRISLPDTLYEKMAEGINIKINSPIENRVKLLVEEYASENNKEEIKDSINHLKKFISNEELNNLLQALEKDDYPFIAEQLCINYYDKRYKNRIKEFDLEFNNDDLDKIIEMILENTKAYFL